MENPSKTLAILSQFMASQGIPFENVQNPGFRKFLANFGVDSAVFAPAEMKNSVKTGEKSREIDKSKGPISLTVDWSPRFLVYSVHYFENVFERKTAIFFEKFDHSITADTIYQKLGLGKPEILNFLGATSQVSFRFMEHHTANSYTCLHDFITAFVKRILNLSEIQKALQLVKQFLKVFRSNPSKMNSLKNVLLQRSLSTAWPPEENATWQSTADFLNRWIELNLLSFSTRSSTSSLSHGASNQLSPPTRHPTSLPTSTHPQSMLPRVSIAQQSQNQLDISNHSSRESNPKSDFRQESTEQTVHRAIHRPRFRHHLPRIHPRDVQLEVRGGDDSGSTIRVSSVDSRRKRMEECGEAADGSGEQLITFQIMKFSFLQKELDLYRSIIQDLPSRNFQNPLVEFWRVHSKSLGALAMMARDYLGCPAISIDASFYFSSDGSGRFDGFCNRYAGAELERLLDAASTQQEFRGRGEYDSMPMEEFDVDSEDVRPEEEKSEEPEDVEMPSTSSAKRPAEAVKKPTKRRKTSKMWEKKTSRNSEEPEKKLEPEETNFIEPKLEMPDDVTPPTEDPSDVVVTLSLQEMEAVRGRVQKTSNSEVPKNSEERKPEKLLEPKLEEPDYDTEDVTPSEAPISANMDSEDDVKPEVATSSEISPEIAKNNSQVVHSCKLLENYRMLTKASEAGTSSDASRFCATPSEDPTMFSEAFTSPKDLSFDDKSFRDPTTSWKSFGALAEASSRGDSFSRVLVTSSKGLKSFYMCSRRTSSGVSTPSEALKSSRASSVSSLPPNPFVASSEVLKSPGTSSEATTSPRPFTTCLEDYKSIDTSFGTTSKDPTSSEAPTTSAFEEQKPEEISFGSIKKSTFPDVYKSYKLTSSGAATSSRIVETCDGDEEEEEKIVLSDAWNIPDPSPPPPRSESSKHSHPPRCFQCQNIDRSVAKNRFSMLEDRQLILLAAVVDRKLHIADALDGCRKKPPQTFCTQHITETARHIYRMLNVQRVDEIRSAPNDGIELTAWKFYKDICRGSAAVTVDSLKDVCIKFILKYEETQCFLCPTQLHRSLMFPVAKSTVNLADWILHKKMKGLEEDSQLRKMKRSALIKHLGTLVDSHVCKEHFPKNCTSAKATLKGPERVFQELSRVSTASDDVDLEGEEEEEEEGVDR
ncbi:Protein CBR-ETS-6 [Caenorhabditis briggsae]|uniref:Protein CBR-ETS-6 n=1 Tax=Caenorhabditis briggsae TaxID=6238 RepID=A8Y2B0_CAEBR|nr:Protein CBR-ETS-6 [Caenorhabditis briggsae]CAP39030.2 Protein CBR-ETS-6 [Caenorhabditis briggsae]